MSTGEGLFNKMLSRFTMKKDKGEEESFTCPVSLITNFEFIVLHGDEAGRKYVLSEQPFTIGRMKSSDSRQGFILIKDKTLTLSSNQADICWNSKKMTHILTPKKTTNITKINGNEITGPTALSANDIIEMGKVILKYQISSEGYVAKVEDNTIINEEPAAIVTMSESFLPDNSGSYLLDENKPLTDEEEDTTTGNADKNKEPPVLHEEIEKYEIYIMDGEFRGERYPVEKNEFIIGRKSKKEPPGLKDIELPASDRSISRKHIKIVKKKDGFYLVNESQKSITLLNDSDVLEPILLKDGDKIKIGQNTVLLFKKLITAEEEDYTIAPFPVAEEDEYTIAPSFSKKDRKEPSTLKMEDEIKDISYSTNKMEEENSSVIESEMPSTIDMKEYVEKDISSDEAVYDRIEDMVFIEEGSFFIGSNDDGDSDSYPLHEVFVKSYYIDIYPVTNQKYRDFVRTTGYKSHGDWESSFAPGKESYPVVNVTWQDAMSYASWADKRLPTEAEWEKAARGKDKRKYPWGNNWDKEKLNSRESNIKTSTPVDRFVSGKSPFGAVDMMGNVWEWTKTSYNPYPYNESEKQGNGKVIRGGSWVNILKLSGCTIRFEAFPEEFGPDIGFRCVKDL